MSANPIDEKEIFNQARRLSAPEERVAYLQEACGGDPAAIARILELLRVHDEERSFLESSPARYAPTSSTPSHSAVRSVIRRSRSFGGVSRPSTISASHV